MKNFYQIADEYKKNPESIFDLTAEEIVESIAYIEQLMEHNHNYSYNELLDSLDYIKSLDEELNNADE